MHSRRQPRYLVFARAAVLPGGVAGAVFWGEARRRDRIAVGVCVAIAAYGALGAWAATRPARGVPEPRLPETTVELMATPSPPPPAPTAPARPTPSRAPLRPVRSAPPRPAAPEQATAVVARDAVDDEPLDLTSFSIMTGGAARFAGGDTASNGASDHAVTGAVAGGTTSPTAGGADLSRPVSISETEWSDCAWPPEADALGIDEQVVSMRAVAAADGRFESAEIVGDPGHGFGAALLACARRHGFVPALDRSGQPLRARSGVLRFTFTR